MAAAYLRAAMQQTLISKAQTALIVRKLACEVLENHPRNQPFYLIGIQPRGVELSNRLYTELMRRFPQQAFLYGQLDITFYRDDFRRRELPVANATNIPFSVENQKVLLIDDVLWSGRTIRAAMDALMDFGRPSRVELCVLIDRRFSRELPIQPNYVGRIIDTTNAQKVQVRWDAGGGEVYITQ